MIIQRSDKKIIINPKGSVGTYNNKIAYFAGTFDPFHKGHHNICNELREQ